jgi:NAD(P)-dependent dehydrogenase (short-subunit alcohol dehydrogenase family)
MRKVVLITGTNSGFGWLSANSLAAAGHTVYATMRDTKGKNAEKAAELGSVNNITVLDVTITDADSVQNAIDQILVNEGRLDVLVNNAGYGAMGVTESFTSQDMQDMFDVHVFANWRLMKAVLPGMRRKAEGLIINVSSGFGRFSFPFMTAYSAAKFGLEAISEGLHYEVKQLGIDVAIVQPGAYPTDIIHKVKTGSDSSVIPAYGALGELPNNMGTSLGKMFEETQPNPQDVADAILDLVNQPRGQRPLRTVVDPSTGTYVQAANEAVQVQYDKILQAFGMGALLEDTAAVTA